MSITLAAQDLCLTQSAISRQIQTLEDRLKTKLFVRGYRSIEFTAEGEKLFRIADSALQQLQDAFGVVSESRDHLPVTITASIGVSALWLLPRLTSLQKRFPGIDVRMAANDRVLDLRNEGIDLAIRYCRESAAPPDAVRLFGEAVIPVAHPSLGVVDLASPKELSNTVLLEYDDAKRPWLQWADRLAAIGASARPKSVLRFNHYDQVIQAALAGQGVALGRLALVAPMLDDGRLIAIDSQPNDAAAELAYWLIQGDQEPRMDVRIVAEWILSEAIEITSGDLFNKPAGSLAGRQAERAAKR